MIHFKPATVQATTKIDANGNWSVALPMISASASATLVADDGHSSASLQNVAVGDLILCGGQSNMGETPQQALDNLPPLHAFYWYCSGPGGGAGKKCQTSAGTASVTPSHSWFITNASTAGGFSAVCLLTAQKLYESMGARVPVGAVASCVSGTSIAHWMPPDADPDIAVPYGCIYRNHTVCGDLWASGIVPLLPMSLKAVLWVSGDSQHYALMSPIPDLLRPKYRIKGKPMRRGQTRLGTASISRE